MIKVSQARTPNAVKISAVIITLNEERNLERCIKSLLNVSDEIIVVDSYSTDKTEDICAAYGVRFIKHAFEGYRDQKNYAVQQAKFDHILSLDADEALSLELEESILKVKQNWKYDGYRFRRLNYYCGQWIKHTDWSPECKIRLYDRTKGEWSGANIHEVVIMHSKAKGHYLKGELLHWRYNTYEEQLQEINKFSSLSAAEYHKMGIKPNFIKLVVHPTWRFIHSFFVRWGFLDGYNGLYISFAISKLCMAKYMKLRAIIKNEKVGLAITQYNNPSVATSLQRIGFDAKRAYFNSSGLGNYSRNLIEALNSYSNQFAYFMFTPKLNKRKHIDAEPNLFIVKPSILVHRVLKSIWRSKWANRDIKKYKIDLYHGLSHELPFGIHRTKIKTILTVHDLIFIRYPQFFQPIDVYIYRKKIEYACKYASKIVAISTQTKSDIIELLHVDSDKIVVIPQGCDERFHKKASKAEVEQIVQKYNLPNRYLLCVGTIEQRKNILSAVKAIHQQNIEIPLVIVGKKTDYYTNELLPYITKHKLTNIIFPPFIPNEDLPAVYQNATCFIYPSLFEGFGIPIIEALTSGIPVITSKGSCFEETGGDACLYIDPNDTQAIGDAINSVVNNSDFRNQLIEKSLKHAVKYSPQIIANQYISLYNSLLNPPKS